MSDLTVIGEPEYKVVVEERHSKGRPLAPKHEPSKPQPHRSQEPDPKPPSPPEPEEPEPDKEEPEKEPAGQMAAMMAKFEQALDTAISAARRPVINEQEERQKRRMKEHMRQLAKDEAVLSQNKFRMCSHMQYPGSVMTGCSVIAWATQSDGVRRGTCMHCGTIFSPKREECQSDEIWEAYRTLVRIPTHPGGNVNSVFQNA